MLWASIRATERRFSTIIRVNLPAGIGQHAIPREIVMGREGRAGRNLAINLARESCNGELILRLPESQDSLSVAYPTHKNNTCT